MADPPRPGYLPPMRAVSGGGDVPPGDDWAFEVKWDGMRAVGFATGGGLVLQSANLIDVTARFPEVAPLGEALAGHVAVVDGELVAFDDRQRPSFGRLQGRMHVASAAEARRRVATTPVSYLVFDLLHLDGEDLMSLPYLERRERLVEAVPQGSCWLVPAHHLGDGRPLLDAATAQGLEGLVAKRVWSRYEPGRRSPAWRKVKVRRRQEVVVGGWLPGERGRAGRIGALVVGVHEGAALRFAGRVGTGFSDRELGRLQGVLDGLRTDRCPFDPPPPRGAAPKATWVEPCLVAEVEFGEWTEAGVLRHPSYLGLRSDKDPAEVVREPDP
jgi:bifunctional non-homologous end joining protein LigD